MKSVAFTILSYFLMIFYYFYWKPLTWLISLFRKVKEANKAKKMFILFSFCIQKSFFWWKFILSEFKGWKKRKGRIYLCTSFLIAIKKHEFFYNHFSRFVIFMIFTCFCYSVKDILLRFKRYSENQHTE